MGEFALFPDSFRAVSKTEVSVKTIGGEKCYFICSHCEHLTDIVGKAVVGRIVDMCFTIMVIGSNK